MIHELPAGDAGRIERRRPRPAPDQLFAAPAPKKSPIELIMALRSEFRRRREVRDSQPAPLDGADTTWGDTLPPSY